MDWMYSSLATPFNSVFRVVITMRIMKVWRKCGVISWYSIGGDDGGGGDDDDDDDDDSGGGDSGDDDDCRGVLTSQSSLCIVQLPLLQCHRCQTSP